jgi:hypothetical protein
MNLRASRRWFVTSAAGVLAFVTIVVVEHLVESDLDPATHEISEYVHGSAGWLMIAGFVAWSLSLVALGIAVAPIARGRPVAVAVLVAAGGLLLAAFCATQTSAGQLPPGVSLTTTGRLHDLGSGIATIALLAAVILSLRLPVAHALRQFILAVLAFAFIADVVLLLIGAGVAGARQRLLVTLACGWQLLLAVLLARDTLWRGARRDRVRQTRTTGTASAKSEKSAS